MPLLQKQNLTLPMLGTRVILPYYYRCQFVLLSISGVTEILAKENLLVCLMQLRDKVSK